MPNDHTRKQILVNNNKSTYDNSKSHVKEEDMEEQVVPQMPQEEPVVKAQTSIKIYMVKVMKIKWKNKDTKNFKWKPSAKEKSKGQEEQLILLQ